MAQLDFDEIVREALEHSGGETITSEEITSARRGIHLILQKWATRGYNTWREKSLVLDLNGATNDHPLPKTLDEVLEVRVSTSTTATDPATGSWSAITRVGRDDFNRISDLDTPGRPSRYYLQRNMRAPVLKMHPRGDGYRAHVLYAARPADFDDVEGGARDAPARWTYALTMSLAVNMLRKRASKRPSLLPILQTLIPEADRAEMDAFVNDRNRQPLRISL